MRELECFFQENCYLPPNEKIMVSDRFEDGELLWESYGAKSSAEVLQKMLTPAEYLRLQKAVMVLNGFQKRKAERRETAKN